ncbi:MAG: DNRLRE domain-containing protein [Draconibacterium sp.]
MKRLIKLTVLFFVFILIFDDSIYAQWTAYNDCSGTNSITNTTNITGVSGTGTLKNFDTGATLTGVTATFVSSGSPSTGASNGAVSNSGTDAYTVFNGKANMVGVVNYGSSSGWYINLTISGLDPAKTYTFITTANRNDASYTSRITRFTISDITSATNASTSGVTVISNESVSFCTGYNTDNGYVARWTGIQPGSDGDFVIKFDYPSSYQAYGPSVFMLQEGASGSAINISGTLDEFTCAPGVASDEQTYIVSGTNLTDDILITAPDDFQIRTDGGTYGSSLTLIQSGGTVAATTIYVQFLRATEGTSSGNITFASTGVTTQNISVSGTAADIPIVLELQYGLNGYTETYDTYIYNTNPSTIRGTETTIVQDYDSETVERRSLLSFNLSSIPAGSTIVSAELEFYVTAEGKGFDMHRMLILWDEATVTYASIGDRHFLADDADAVSTVDATWTNHDGETGFSSLEIPASTIQGWVDGTFNNYGWLMIATDNPGGDGQQLASKENGTQERNPKLTINYYPGVITSPQIMITSNLSAFTIEPGTPSAEQSYAVSGTNLTDNIVITAPTDFQIKEDGGTYASEITLVPTDGTVESTIIYVQFYRDTEGTSSGNITHSSTDATTKNIVVSGIAALPHIEVRISASSDDAEELETTGAMDLTSSDLEIVHDALDASGTDQIVGIRFQNVEIPQGATITSAYIEFETDETDNEDPCDLTIYGQADDNPSTFTSSAYNISNRTKTTAFSNWSPDDWTTVDEIHQTEDISAVVQELVNRAGWGSGNSMVYIIEGTGQRIAEAYDGETSAAALLVVNYIISTDPAIYVSETSLDNFTSESGSTLAEQSYVVSGMNLNEAIEISAPADFEISTSSGSGFSSSLTLAQTDGTVASTTVFVRMNSTTTGAKSGNIVHSSSGAVSKNVAVSGTVTEHGEGWIAYNDCAYIDGQTTTNITTYECYTNSTSGLLKKFTDNSNTAVTVTVTTSGTVDEQITSDYYGAETNSGTDAYTTFHDYVNMIGGVRLGTLVSYIELTFTGLDASKTYTFATSANRANSEYTERISKFTLSDVDAATNSSTSGVTEIDNLSVSFSTGYNTENGYVARWTEIQSGADGDFTVRFEVASTENNYAYGPAVFLLQEGSGSTSNETPNLAVLVQPDDEEANVSTSPTLEVTVSDPDNDELTVTFYGRAVTTSTVGEDFTLIAVPDIQNESQYAPAMISSQMNWIVAQQSANNIVFVTSLGDLVNTATDATQWTNADAGFDILDVAGVPYSVGPGNHDLTTYTTTTLYPTYFGSSRFASKSWYGDSMTSDNFNNYSLFSESGMDFIVINLQYSPTTAMLDWADALLKANPDRRGIYVQHNILNIDNSWQSQTSYTALKDNPNLFLMLCGHMHSSTDGAAYRSELGDDGHTIHIMQADYQDFSYGNGYLRILRFSPANDKIYATTYSPYLPASIATYPDEMDMEYDMEGGSSSFEVLGMATVESGSNASFSWAGLTSGTEYEWFAVVSDGLTTSTSSTWSFTTGSSGAFTLAATGDENGSVTLSPSGGSYASGTTVTLIPEPNTGYHFSAWSGTDATDIVETAGIYTILIDENKTVSASFEPNTYTLSVSTEGSGSVTLDPADGTYPFETTVKLTPVPQTGYHFSGWSGTDAADIVDNEGVYTIVIDEDKSVTATFTQNTSYILTLTTSVGGSVTLDPEGGTYVSGTTVILTPVVLVGYTFSGWTGANGGDVVETAGVYTIVMDEDKSIAPSFTVSSVLGDVDGDLQVTSSDALIVLSCDAGLDTEQFCPMNCGDVNGDGIVDSSDALIILTFDAGMSVPYPLGQPAYPSGVTPCRGCGE